MGSRGPFGLSGRRLHVCLLSFFIIATFLYGHYRAASLHRPDGDGDDKYHAPDSADLKEGLAKWEAPPIAPESAASGQGGGGETAQSIGRVPETCKSTRPREDAGHVTAFLIMVHNNVTLEGARRLIEQIYDPNDLFLLHADKKMDANVYEQYRTTIEACGNIQFVPDDERVKIGWGDIVSLFSSTRFFGFRALTSSRTFSARR